MIKWQRSFKRAISKSHFHPQLLQPLKKKERKTLLIQHQQHSGKFRDRMIKSSVAALPGAPLSQGQWQQHDIGGGGVAEPSRTRIQVSGVQVSGSPGHIGEVGWFGPTLEQKQDKLPFFQKYQRR